MEDLFTVLSAETSCSIRHETVALSSSDFWTKVGFFMLTVNAFLFVALRGVAWNYDITDGDSSDTLTDAFDDTCGFVAQNARELSLWIAAVQCVDVSVAECI